MPPPSHRFAAMTTAAPAATAADFTRWAEKARTMTDAELLYSARDCRQAEAAMLGHCSALL
ncbi:hypothetical protein [Cyanobium sp. N5-Cardenillas]|uniref:hypothetical protein n=1 Tax=Cyanobium sp. N5-Cardenillas TaxID=2823720 RepID=UPI0020CD5397|nr:hypothetical protein [Cyanobium sp. N5-Cardenillas]MCP9787339.1 hypothetical protein [Cyanobium sp. N5-Cardenillas]